MPRSYSLACSALFAALLGCSAPRSPAFAPTPLRSSTSANIYTPFIQPSRILPDLPDDVPIVGFEADGSARILYAQMRVIDHPDGSLERAPGLLPSGRSNLTTLELPSRMNGGVLFVSSNESSTMIWSASSWLAPAKPLSAFNLPVSDIQIGFDRIYLRHKRTRGIFAFDPISGAWTDPGPLPTPARFGSTIFADAWRAVVVTDLLGPMASFNAGTTWTPIPISSPISNLSLVNDTILIDTESHRFSLDSQGTLLALGKRYPNTDRKRPSQLGLADADSYPLGRRPIVSAIEHGIPISPSSAAVAASGNVYLVDTSTGRIDRVVHNSYPKSYTDCHGIPLGEGLGFVCGQANGPTTIFSLSANLHLEQVLSWPYPCIVVPSGNGSIVAHAPCPASSTPTAGQTPYCTRNRKGALRDLRFQGDLGAERLVVLSDGRIAAIIAPRFGDPGAIVTIDSKQSTRKALSFSELPLPKAEIAKKALFLDGAFESAPGKIGVWLDAAASLMPLQISLDGSVRAGDLFRPPLSVMFSGRFAITWNGVKGRESLDGGMTFRDFDAPFNPSTQEFRNASRGCSAVGCLFGPFIRVGWGPSADSADAEAVATPKSSFPPFTNARVLDFTCFPTGLSSPAPLPITPPRNQNFRGATAPVKATPIQRGFLPFASSPPPAIGATDDAFGFGRDYGEPKFRAYVWGPSNGDWARQASWLLRFDDPFSSQSPPFSSLPSPVIWQDSTIAAAAFNGSSVSLLVDPSGSDGLFQICTSTRQCTLFAVQRDHPLLKLNPDNLPSFPVMSGILRVADAWYLLEKTAASASIWLSDASGSTRKLLSLPRASTEPGDSLMLIRQQRGSQIALLTTSSVYGASSQKWVAIPIDTEEGKAQGAQSLVPNDLRGIPITGCTSSDDGWLVETSLPIAPNLRNPAAQIFGTSVKLRLILSPDTACVQSISARARSTELGPNVPAPPSATIPLSAWDQGLNRKTELLCQSPKP